MDPAMSRREQLITKIAYGVIAVCLVSIVIGAYALLIDKKEDPNDIIPESFPIDSYPVTDTPEPEPTVTEPKPITFEEPSYSKVRYDVKNVNGFDRPNDSEIKIDFVAAPRDWEITKTIKGKTDRGSECFIFNVNSPLSESQLVIEFLCENSYGAEYVAIPDSAVLVKPLIDFYKGNGEGSKFILRETTSNSSYTYGQANSYMQQLDRSQKTYQRIIFLASTKGLNNHDAVPVVIKANMDIESGFADKELAVFDKVVSNLYFEVD